MILDHIVRVEDVGQVRSHFLKLSPAISLTHDKLRMVLATLRQTRTNLSAATADPIISLRQFLFRQIYVNRWFFTFVSRQSILLFMFLTVQRSFGPRWRRMFLKKLAPSRRLHFVNSRTVLLGCLLRRSSRLPGSLWISWAVWVAIAMLARYQQMISTRLIAAPLRFPVFRMYAFLRLVEMVIDRLKLVFEIDPFNIFKLDLFAKRKSGQSNFISQTQGKVTYMFWCFTLLSLSCCFSVRICKTYCGVIWAKVAQSYDVLLVSRSGLYILSYLNWPSSSDSGGGEKCIGGHSETWNAPVSTIRDKSSLHLLSFHNSSI